MLLWFRHLDDVTVDWLCSRYGIEMMWVSTASGLTRYNQTTHDQPAELEFMQMSLMDKWVTSLFLPPPHTHTEYQESHCRVLTWLLCTCKHNINMLSHTNRGYHDKVVCGVTHVTTARHRCPPRHLLPCGLGLPFGCSVYGVTMYPVVILMSVFVKCSCLETSCIPSDGSWISNVLVSC